MSEMQNQRRIGRSIGAVLVGIVVAIAATLFTDLGLHAAGVFPPSGQRAADGALLLATAYRVLYGVAAAYVTAWLAPSRPLLHSLTGGFIGLVVSAAGAIATWNRGPEFGPHWYPVALIIFAMPSAWLGGVLNGRRQAGMKEESA
jgi:hypothetical protein